MNHDFCTRGSFSKWHSLHFAHLEAQISWQAQYFVGLEAQISWQAQYFVGLEVQISYNNSSTVDL